MRGDLRRECRGHSCAFEIARHRAGRAVFAGSSASVPRHIATSASHGVPSIAPFGQGQPLRPEANFLHMERTTFRAYAASTIRIAHDAMVAVPIVARAT